MGNKPPSLLSPEDWESGFKAANAGRKKRMKSLLNLIEKEFPNDRAKMNQRGQAEAIIWALFGGPILLYSLGMNGPALVDLQGILERLSIREIAVHLSGKNSAHRAIIQELIGRKSLVDLAVILNKIGIWDADDLAWANRMASLRNGSAHKNPKPLGVSSYLDIDEAISKMDIIPCIIRSIRLPIKLFSHHLPKGDEM